jgi:pyruvate dehydrogenase E1 component beta subunit
MREISYADAVREAMSEEMRRDESVFFMGEDIGVYNGAFGVSKGMIQEFGEERVRETPIAETGFIGAGVGAAMMGMRPICELMFSDFMSVCWDQIMNQAAKVRFMLGGMVSVPLVIRTASGGGTGAAAQHSQSLENLYAHIPGLKLVIPSTPYDAKGLLKTAIRDNNPVIFLEQKKLYRTKGPVPDGEYTIPLGVADVKREGGDVSLITYGRMVQMCMDVAEKLAAEGVGAEVLDIRSLVPLDKDAVIESVKKTRRAVIVHEAVEFSGYGAEIAATIADSEAFYYLDAPIKRVGAYYLPIPFNPVLEASNFPTPERIETAVRETLTASPADVRITPLARRVAEVKGLDVHAMKGSGRLGKIFVADLSSAASRAIAAHPDDEVSVVKMNGVRRTIAQRMGRSSRETAPVTQFMEMDATELLELRGLMNEGAGVQGRITVTSLIVKAMAIAVREHERFRMQLNEQEDGFLLQSAVHIGIAVGTDEGLFVPVLRHADKKSVREINAELSSLSRKARDGALLPDDYAGGVITLSNMGMYGVTAFTPIINQPEASIMGIGAPARRLAMYPDGIRARSIITQSLTYDHRIVNGTEAAGFQLRIKDLVERPEQLT